MSVFCRSLLQPTLMLGLGVWLVGCAGDDSPAPGPDQRPRIDQILSPQGSKPNDAYTKRSRYDGQDFKARSLGKKSYAGAGRDGRAREGGQAFSGAGKEARWSRQESRYGSEAAREGGQAARTFASRFDNQEARTETFRGAQEEFRTGEAREADDAFYTGQPRGYSTRTLEATQLSQTARETASLYPANAAAPLNVEDVRRVLNKGPRER
jgi:hypothetical protein